ncbi:GNAT family N-acetyltransferase [bacterium]|nr:GNAT family N-acetyltransferase [bacterium]
MKPLSDVVWDPTIQTLPEYRGMGYAKSAVSAAVKYILDNGKIATWGADRTNIASLHTAHALGFQDYGLDFGCVGSRY